MTRGGQAVKVTKWNRTYDQSLLKFFDDQNPSHIEQLPDIQYVLNSIPYNSLHLNSNKTQKNTNAMIQQMYFYQK